MAPPAVGGVCAHLDYEVDQMADYISEMAQRIVMPGSPVSPAFRKFCSGLLSSTRLPSTTILLGMNYLARRMNMLNANGPYKATEGQVWRMLTISLLLGSKFLDDNTFQNRSWSEVSGIPVSELNKLEHEWLDSIQWNLYVNLDDSKDFQAWLQSWSDWCQTKNQQRASTLERLAPLAPIDTNVQRARPYPQQYSAYPKTAARERPQSGFVPYEHTAWVNQYPTPHLTPPSAPDSGVNTPEYLSATGGAPRWNDWALYNQHGLGRGYQQAPIHATYVPTRVAAYNTPFSSHYTHHQYGSNIWDSSVSDCSCNHCNPYVKQQPYFMGHGYGQQIVAG